MARECQDAPYGASRACRKLLDIAKSAKEKAPVRISVIAALWDQQALTDIAGTDGDSGIRLAAAGRLNQLLVDAAAQSVASDPEGRLARAAVKRLTDQASLAQVALTAAHQSVALEARGRPTDQALLAKVVEKLADQSVLAKIAVEDHDQGVRRAARKDGIRSEPYCGPVDRTR
ncbi:MAG TPA: hypothetical protein VN924_21765 [Bryobacteraceae bacterium]|nr:hypothetical protein [Bryobacteraceae bacterium]